jgi:hypothetical protein
MIYGEEHRSDGLASNATKLAGECFDRTQTNSVADLRSTNRLAASAPSPW